MNTKHTIPNVALAFAAMFLLPGYSSCDPIIPNNGFDLWCGDTLCNWDVEKGDIAKVSTWHERDHGVELIGDAAAISTLSDVASTDGVACLRFDLLADIEPNAEVTLQMDVYDDGVVDWERPIPASEWANLHYLVKMPDYYQGLRFRISKTGSGRVVLAQIAAEEAMNCEDPQLVVSDQPSGAYCNGSDMCASGICATQVASFDVDDVCSECASDDDCTPGDVCGAEAPTDQPFLDMYRACGAPARHELGERCVSDDECTTGICHENVCSTCQTNADCDANQGSCEPRERVDDLTFWWAPHQCAPAGGLAETGTACLIDDDCASASCAGGADLSVCLLDGRVCGDDTDCPDDLQCVSIGITGGACQ
jgi:hypothetical protein